MECWNDSTTDERAAQLVATFAGRRNSEEVLAEKGREYAKLIAQWAAQDATSLVERARHLGASLISGPELQARFILLYQELAATYLIRAVVLAHHVFPGPRIQPWADALIDMLKALMGVAIDGQGNTRRLGEGIFQKYFEPNYSSDAVHGRFLGSRGAHLCEILGTKGIDLQSYLDEVLWKRFADLHVPKLLADGTELDFIVAWLRNGEPPSSIDASTKKLGWDLGAANVTRLPLSGEAPIAHENMPIGQANTMGRGEKPANSNLPGQKSGHRKAFAWLGWPVVIVAAIKLFAILNAHHDLSSKLASQPAALPANSDSQTLASATKVPGADPTGDMASAAYWLAKKDHGKCMSAADAALEKKESGQAHLTYCLCAFGDSFSQAKPDQVLASARDHCQFAAKDSDRETQTTAQTFLVLIALRADGCAKGEAAFEALPEALRRDFAAGFQKWAAICRDGWRLGQPDAPPSELTARSDEQQTPDFGAGEIVNLCERSCRMQFKCAEEMRRGSPEIPQLNMQECVEACRNLPSVSKDARRAVRPCFQCWATSKSCSALAETGFCADACAAVRQ